MATSYEQISRAKIFDGLTHNRELYLNVAKMINIIYLGVKIDTDLDYVSISSWDFYLIGADQRRLECNVLLCNDEFTVTVSDNDENVVYTIVLVKLNKIALLEIDKPEFMYEADRAYDLNLLNKELLKSINGLIQ